MRHLLVTVVLLGLLAIAIPACGDDDDGGGDLSKEDYIAKADAICKKANDRETESGVPPGGTAIDDPQVQRSVVKILGETVADLRELEAPDGDQDTAAKIISSLEAARAAREDQFAAARANDGPAESKAKSTFITASQDLGASAGRFGMTYCQSLGF